MGIPFLRLTKKDIIVFSQQHQMELSFENKTKEYAQATFKDLAKTFEVVIKQLEHCGGVAGTPLAYVPCQETSTKDTANTQNMCFYCASSLGWLWRVVCLYCILDWPSTR
jgi:hypothetical protein